MLGRFLLILGSIWLGRISIHNARQLVKKRAICCEDRISALSDDLLVQILLLVPTKHAVATMILSKRWQFVWTMVPRLEYKEIIETRKTILKREQPQSIWRFLNESMRLHKAPILERLAIELGPHCPVDVRLFSSCPNLSYLHVERDHEDNVTKFTVKVPTLETITYFYNGGPLSEDHGGSLVIDSASLKKLCISDYWTKSCSIENKPRLDNAIIYIWFYPDQEFMRCLSSVIMYLELNLSVETVACCEAIQFSQLTECKIRPFELNWFKPLVLLLQNSPKLKVLVIDQVIFRNEFFPLSCKQPSSRTNMEERIWRNGQRERSSKIHFCQLKVSKESWNLLEINLQ